MSASPAEIHTTPVDGVHVLGALSPSRASDFMACPLLYRFRTIDKLPEPPSPDATRGSLVHKVLEELFDLPAASRTPEEADARLEPTWVRLVEEKPELAGLFEDASEAEWLMSCRSVLARYFTLEDPSRIEPAERELYVESVLDSKLLLRGFVDRLDVAPTGEIRVVDYKSGRSPGEMFEAKALFQLKIYALVVWRTRGVVPHTLKLIYLGNAEVLTYHPDEADLRATERKIVAVWGAIRQAQASGDWRPNRSRMCSWCAHQAICPEFGGTPPPLPERVEAAPVEAVS